MSDLQAYLCESSQGDKNFIATVIASSEGEALQKFRNAFRLPEESSFKIQRKEWVGWLLI